MFYLILFLAIFIPLILKGKHPSLKLAFMLLFIPWGLHYNMTQDWNGYLLSWNIINNSTSDVVYSHGDTVYEPIYTFLIRFFAPIGFMGFQIVIALFALSIFYIYVKKYVNSKFYWLSIYILMVLPGYGLLYINSIRQTLALVFSMLASYVLMNVVGGKSIWKLFIKIIISAILILIGANIHSSAYVAFAIIPIYLISKYTKNVNVLYALIISNILFFSRYFIDITQYQQLFAMQLENSSVDSYLYTIQELENVSKISSFETLTFWIVMNLIVLYYNKLSPEFRYMGLLVYVAMIANGFLINTLARVLLYFNVYLIFIAYVLIVHFNREKKYLLKVVRNPIYLLLFSYTLFAFIRLTLTSQYYSKWSHFETVFSAPSWI